MTTLPPVKMKWIIEESDRNNGTGSWNCETPLIMWFAVISFSLTFTIPGAIVILINIVLKNRQRIPFSTHDVFMTNINAMDVIYSIILSSDLYSGGDYSDYDDDDGRLKIAKFFNALCFTGRPLLLTCVSVDTYLAVVHPVTYRARKSLSSRLLIIAGVWICTIALGCYFVVSEVDMYDDAPTLLLVVTLLIITFCDFSIFWTLKKPGPGGKNINPQKKKAMRIVIKKCIITFLTYFPILVNWLLKNIMQVSSGYFFCVIYLPTLCFSVAGSTISVILQVSNLITLDWLKGRVCFCRSLLII